jgi:hypothetical protein
MLLLAVGDMRLIKKLIARGANINAPDPFVRLAVFLH